MSIRKTAWAALPLILAACAPKTTAHHPAALASHPTPKATVCEPAIGREGQPGCWVLATAPLEALTTPLYWHVYEFPSTEQAQHHASETAKVIRAHDRAWLVAVADRQWRVTGGRLVARVGPLTLLSSAPHTASFMEATFTPGMSSRIHTHPGPEAWVVLEGEQCLETPEGVTRGSAGDAMQVRGGIPMQLFGGTAVRRALVLILHPTAEPLGTPHRDWHPSGACLAAK